ncbi:MAG: MBL fold metallo-hydrolase [Nibricoccus sp.]
MRLHGLFVGITCLGGALFSVGCTTTPKKGEALFPVELVQATAGKPHVRFFGVSTLEISDGNQSILIDGYFTRRSVIGGHLIGFWTNKRRVDFSWDKLGKPPAAILTAHNHFDHSLDSAFLASRTTEKKIYGSVKTIEGVPERFISKGLIGEALTDGKAFNVAGFKITPIETDHSPDSWAMRLIKGVFFLPGNWQFDYDRSFAFLIEMKTSAVLVVPSAGLSKKCPKKGDQNSVDDGKGSQAFEGMIARIAEGRLKIDAVFLSIGNLDGQRHDTKIDYINEWVGRTGAKVVVPIHFDCLQGSLEHPLKLPPKCIDNPSAAVQLLEKETNDDVQILVMPINEPAAIPLQKFKDASSPPGFQ